MRQKFIYEAQAVDFQKTEFEYHKSPCKFHFGDCSVSRFYGTIKTMRIFPNGVPKTTGRPLKI